jgi:hypothetical protein
MFLFQPPFDFDIHFFRFYSQSIDSLQCFVNFEFCDEGLGIRQSFVVNVESNGLVVFVQHTGFEEIPIRVHCDGKDGKKMEKDGKRWKKMGGEMSPLID